jgi:hypothetical protein
LPVDPRLDWTVGRDGVPYKDWGAHAPGVDPRPAYGGPYSPKKNVHEKASGAQSTVGWNPTQLNSVNIHIFRYADMLLLLAEAEVEAGSLENARAIVNEIRTRAGVRVQGPGTDRATMAVPINNPRSPGRVPRRPVHHAVRQPGGRPQRRPHRAPAGARDGRPALLRPAARWGNGYLAVERTRRPHLAGASPVTDGHRLYPIPAVQIELSRRGDAEAEPRLVSRDAVIG